MHRNHMHSSPATVTISTTLLTWTSKRPSRAGREQSPRSTRSKSASTKQAPHNLAARKYIRTSACPWARSRTRGVTSSSLIMSSSRLAWHRSRRKSWGGFFSRRYLGSLATSSRKMRWEKTWERNKKHASEAGRYCDNFLKLGHLCVRSGVIGWMGTSIFAFLFQTVFGEMGVKRRNDAYVEWMMGWWYQGMRT
jgi:hypothetical protein